MRIRRATKMKPIRKLSSGNTTFRHRELTPVNRPKPNATEQNERRGMLKPISTPRPRWPPKNRKGRLKQNHYLDRPPLLPSPPQTRNNFLHPSGSIRVGGGKRKSIYPKAARASRRAGKRGAGYCNHAVSRAHIGSKIRKKSRVGQTPIFCPHPPLSFSPRTRNYVFSASVNIRAGDGEPRPACRPAAPSSRRAGKRRRGMLNHNSTPRPIPLASN